VYRLKDKNSGKEFMTWNEHLEFRDRMDNIHTLDYSRCGLHELAIGDVRKDIRMKVIWGEVTGIKLVFDKEWSPKVFEELMKQHQREPKQTDYVIGFTKNTGRNSHYSEGDKIYSISNAQDFKTAKFEELWELGRRGLSGTEPSISRLQNPISEDPVTSEVKRERFYTNPYAISYTQKTYQ
jgi:hypothetical protein